MNQKRNGLEPLRAVKQAGLRAFLAAGWRGSLIGLAAVLLVAAPGGAGPAAGPSAAPGLEAEAAAPALASRGLGGRWVAQGPGPIQFAQVENIVPDNEAVGAIHAVAPHPTNPDILFAGTVNGGIWRTDNATALQPRWKRQTDEEASLSIGTIKFDPTDSKRRTLWAGIGLYSSYARIGGARTGLLRTTNLGNKWKAIDGGGILVGKNIASVEARGNVVVVAVNIADAFTFPNIGLFRSANGGNTFTQISGAPGSGLPGGVTYDLVGDPNNPAVLYTSVDFADLVGGVNGVYKSTDTGATWTKVSDPAIESLLISGVTSNVEFAVGQHNNVYVAIANSGRLAGLFRSGDGGATWTSLDLPATGPAGVGIHPGGQASIHMSIVADPTDADIVYVGGDRQPFAPEEGLPGFFPNSIGAENFSGRLFRIDASLPSGSQFAHLTNDSSLGPAGGGTASNSSPHADSREMAFNVLGEIVEVDDGGIYKRTSPRSDTGDWFSLNGDMQVNEQHDAMYDELSRIIMSGNQDNGTTVQSLPDDVRWYLELSGDGGDVAVDNSNPAFSIRFGSAQFLQAFFRTFYDAGNNFLGFDFPSLTVIGGGAPLVPQFTTPIEVNAVDPTRIVFGGENSLYESFDQGFTLTEAGPGVFAVGTGRNPIAYGAPDNPDILYSGDLDGVVVRTGPPPAPLVATPFPGTGSGLSVRAVVLNSENSSHAYVAHAVGIFQTLDTGATWTEITGNVFTAGARRDFRSLAYIPRAGHDILVLGANNGTFYSRENTGFTVWKPLGTKLPNVPVYDLKWHPNEDLLVAGTLGRGAWKLDLGDDDDDDDDD